MGEFGRDQSNDLRENMDNMVHVYSAKIHLLTSFWLKFDVFFNNSKL
jgi:hypothetical protein